MSGVAPGTRLRAGVLAIQGAVDKHRVALEQLGAEVRLVLRKEDLEGLDLVVLPGGESTTIAMGLERLGLYEPLQEFARRGGSLLGTCCGAILLARESENHPVRTLGLMNLRADRNAYGTQVDSFATRADADSDPAFEAMRCVFIRAPRLGDLGPEVEVLVRVDGAPCLVRQGALWAATFHPELTDDLRVHRAVLEGCRAAVR